MRRIVVVARGHTAEHHGHDATFDPNIESCFSSHAIGRPESFVLLQVEQQLKRAGIPGCQGEHLAALVVDGL